MNTHQQDGIALWPLRKAPLVDQLLQEGQGCVYLSLLNQFQARLEVTLCWCFIGSNGTKPATVSLGGADILWRQG